MGKIKAGEYSKEKDNFLKHYDEIKEEYKYTNEEILEEIQVNSDIPTGTFNDTISKCHSNLNARVVIAFCHRFDIDVNEIYYNDKISKRKSTDNSTTFYHSKDFHILSDEKFFGKYYGYYVNSEYNELDSFILNIDYDSRHEVQAELRLKCYHLSNNRINGVRVNEPIEKVLHGIPMHLENNFIYIMFQQESGDEFYAMGYKWFSINHGKRLYFRHGAFLTQVRDETRIPSVESFVMSDRPIEEKNLHYVKGYLKLSHPYIFVPVDSLDAAIEENPLLKSYIEKTKYNLTSNKCYAISENSIAQSGKDSYVNFDDIAETICLLKELSINPSLISYPDDKTIAKYIASLCEEIVESDETELTE